MRWIYPLSLVVLLFGGQGRATECSLDYDCLSSEFCALAPGETRGQCLPLNGGSGFELGGSATGSGGAPRACQVDLDCPPGSTCLRYGLSGQCF